MIANVINKIIENNLAAGRPQKLVFVIAILSSAELPFQMERNLNEYKRYIKGLYNVKRKESPPINKIKNKDASYDLNSEENTVIILGLSSFGKGRIFTKQGLLEGFINQIQKQEYSLIYIRDEVHHSGNPIKDKIM